MVIVGLSLAALAALIHVYIFVLESLTWTTDRTRRVFGVRTRNEAELTKPLAFNQGFYNLFLAIIVGLGIVLLAVGAPVVGATLVFAGAGSMAAAGVVLLLSNRRMQRPALIQAAPPLVAMISLGFGLAAG
jgi:putative membrane protein